MQTFTESQLDRLIKNVNHRFSQITLREARENIVNSGLTVESFLAAQEFQIKLAELVEDFTQTRIKEGMRDFGQVLRTTSALMGGALATFTFTSPFPGIEYVAKLLPEIVQCFAGHFVSCALVDTTPANKKN